MATPYIRISGKDFVSGEAYEVSKDAFFKYDLAANQFAATLRYLSPDGSINVFRSVISGNFTYGSSPSGSINRASLFNARIISGKTTESAQSYNFSNPISFTDWIAGYPSVKLPDDASSVNYFYTNSPDTTVEQGRFTEVPVFSRRDSLGSLTDLNYFKDGWWQDPFNFSLTSSASGGTENTTTVDKDILIGSATSKDTFTFSATSSFGKDTADHITNFVAKGKFKDTLAISKNAYGLSTSKPTLKSIRSDKALGKAAASKSLFVYDKRDGGLYLNADGKTAGFGETGGLFAVLDNRVGLTVGNISLI